MKTFKRFITEIVAGSLSRNTKLRGMEEHDEIHHQLAAHAEGHVQWHPDIHRALEHLSNPDNFKNALSNGVVERYTPEKFKDVGNTDAGMHLSKLPGSIDREKLKRAKEQLASGQSHAPIILRTHNKKTGETKEHLIAGNTAATVRGGHIQALVIHHHIG